MALDIFVKQKQIAQIVFLFDGNLVRRYLLLEETSGKVGSVLPPIWLLNEQNHYFTREWCKLSFYFMKTLSSSERTIRYDTESATSTVVCE